MNMVPFEFSGDIKVWLETDDASTLRQDIIAWARWLQREGTVSEIGAALFGGLSEFRSLFDYRTLHSQNGACFAHQYANLRRANDLYLQTPNIGPGLKLQHAHSTWVLAESIGSDCFINHNVTIGWSDGSPKIGNNVTIRTGAVIVGPITIGDRVVIAPNSFINFDVPSNSYTFPPKTVIVPRKR
jgi:serine O-acetyltransferase